MKYTSKKYSGGQAVMLSVLFFLVLSGIIMAGITVPTANQIKNSSEALNARRSYLAADSANDDAIYRLNQGWTLPGSFVLPFTGGVTSLATVTTNAQGATEISVVGDAGTPSRASKSVVSNGTGVSFTYSAQVGTGGIELDSSYITGNVYSNGNIIMTRATSYITGSATVANDSYPALDQTNSGGTMTDVEFGRTATALDTAQGFQVSTTASVSFLRVYLKRTSSSPSDITLRIVSASGSNPGGTTLASKTITAASVTTSFAYIAVPLSAPVALTPGVQYWLVLDYTGSNNNSKYYTTKVTPGTYANGVAKSGVWSASGGGTWNAVSPASGDMVFDLYAGGTTNKIMGEGPNNRLSIGSGSTGTAWAYEVTNASVGGNMYCQTNSATYNLSGVSKSCISQTSAALLDFPISAADINEWKALVTDAVNAISGGWIYTGNLTVNYLGTTTTSLKRVNGNLTLQCNSDKPATFGDLYITGNLSVNSGCVAYLNTLKVDGNISISSPVTVGLTKVGGTVDIASNTTLKLKNTLWSVGNITLTPGNIILDSSLGTGDGLVMSDARIDGSNGGGLRGSGTSGSYIVAISLSDCPGNCGGVSYAVSLNGNAGAVSVFAPYGTVSLSGGSHLKQVSAEKLMLAGNSSVDYEAGLADIDFGSGPSSGWVVESWDEIGQ